MLIDLYTRNISLKRRILNYWHSTTWMFGSIIYNNTWLNVVDSMQLESNWNLYNGINGAVDLAIAEIEMC